MIQSKGGITTGQPCISKATLGRLPQYLCFLERTDARTVSATAIAKALNLGEVQVRKDLAAVSGAGRPRIGYETCELAQKLQSVLGCGTKSRAVIVGAGKLGKALLDYEGFSKYGLEIVGAFDIDKRKAAETESGKSVYHIDSLEEKCSEWQVRIGIITVPAESAQIMCDRLVGAGVSAIWSFAPCALNVPDGVAFRREDLALSLAHLNLMINDEDRRSESNGK